MLTRRRGSPFREFPCTITRVKTRSAERGQAIVLVLIVVALIAGGYWMLLSSRTSREEGALRFAQDAAHRLVLQQDMRFLNQTLAPRAQVLYPPSWRERFFGYIRALGPVQGAIEMEGHVSFTSQFFSPVGTFHGRFNVASGPASVEIHFSHPGVRWEIDGLNLNWTATPTPTPTPIATPVATATPPPSPTPRRRK